jgi:hypothetical protein
MLFTIITPTTGNYKLKVLLESLNNQKINNEITIEHYIVIDGPEFKNKTNDILENVISVHNRFIFELPFNTGNDNYFGHKIYASISQLSRGDYVLLLDEDNWLDVDHIQNYYNILKKNNLQWCFSLRKIVSNEGEYLCNDNCESLGFLHNSFYNPEIYMIDTNCTCVSRDIVIKISNIWNKKGFNTNDDPDRIYSRILMDNFKKYDCTYEYSVNYRVANRQNSVKSEMFIKGNNIILEKFGGVIPWKNANRLVVVHFNKDNTEKIIKRIYSTNKESIAFKQWQLNILDCMGDKFVMSGYNKHIPSGSKIIIHMCNPDELPKALLERKDIEKILYTIESPNIRHQEQWDLGFMLNNFTKIATYWKSLLDISNQFNNCISYFPFIHRFDFNNPKDIECIIENNNIKKNVCIILEKRDIHKDYKINGVGLKSQDYLRWEYAKYLGKRLYCYGKTWEEHAELINYCETKNRFLDQERVIDIMKDYTFALIIENCNADGYVSEKLYDALTVGCIPLYYGNNNKKLGIPEDCFIDITHISPRELPILIDNIDINFIEMFRKNIYKKRMDILKRVSVNEYNKFLSNSLF